jgi:hypothetical protein
MVTKDSYPVVTLPSEKAPDLLVSVGSSTGVRIDVRRSWGHS